MTREGVPAGASDSWDHVLTEWWVQKLYRHLEVVGWRDYLEANSYDSAWALVDAELQMDQLESGDLREQYRVVKRVTTERVLHRQTCAARFDLVACDCTPSTPTERTPT